MSKIETFIAVRPVFDSTTGVFYEPGSEVRLSSEIVNGDGQREVDVRAKGGLVKPDADVLKEVRARAVGLPAGYDRKGTIQAQPGPQADHRVPADVLTADQITGDEPLADVEVEVGGTSRAKRPTAAEAKVEADKPKLTD